MGYYEFFKAELPNERKEVNEKFKNEIAQTESEIENAQKEIDRVTKEKSDKLEKRKKEIEQYYNAEIEKIEHQDLGESLTDRADRESDCDNEILNITK